MQILVENSILNPKPGQFWLFIWKIRGLRRIRTFLIIREKTEAKAKQKLRQFMRQKNVQLICNTNPLKPIFRRIGVKKGR